MRVAPGPGMHRCITVKHQISPAADVGSNGLPERQLASHCKYFSQVRIIIQTRTHTQHTARSRSPFRREPVVSLPLSEPEAARSTAPSALPSLFSVGLAVACPGKRAPNNE